MFMRTVGKKVVGIIAVYAQIVFLIGPAIPALIPAASAQEVTSTPTLTTDKSDYNPGSVVTITGADFPASSSYSLTVSSGTPTDDYYFNDSASIFSDTQGSFTYQYTLDFTYRPLYTVTAYNDSGAQVAQTTFTDAPNPSVSIEQCDNGAVGGTPVACDNPGNPNNHYGSGNVNGSKAHWQEGDFLPYRAILKNLNPGVNTVTFSFDTAKSSELKHAIDYLGSFDYTETTSLVSSPTHANHNDPCGDVFGCNPAVPTAVAAIPVPTYFTTLYPTSCANGTFSNAADVIAGQIKAWSAVAGGVSAMSLSYPDGTMPTSGDCSPRFKITFTVAAGTSDVVIAWGGHVAVNTATGVGGNWGAGNAVPTGSPYHMHAGFAQESPVPTTYNVGSQDLQLASNAIVPTETPVVTTNIHLGTNHATDIQGTTIALGSTIHDKATVAPTANNGQPTGSVSFTFFNNGTCANTGTASGTVALVAGVADPSTSQGPLATGAYSFKAHFTSGDATKWNDADGPCETVTVGQGTSTVATTLHDAQHNPVTVGSSVPIGTMMHDLATVTPSGSFAPSGNVDFRFYTSLAACTGDTTFSAGTVLQTLALNGANPGVAHMTIMTPPLNPGTYAFKAKYAGDGNYAGNTGSCENFTVNQGTSSITTELHKANEDVVAVGGHVALGTIMHDQAHVTPSGPTPATGNVSFTLYPTNNCTGQGTAMGSVPLNIAGTAHPSDSTPALAAGDYSFQATWSGDSNFTGSISSCENFTVDKAQLGVTTNVHDAAHADITNGSVALGSIVHDTATLSGVVGGFTPPTPSFTLTSNYTNSCANGSAVATNGTEGSAAKSADSAALGAGTYAYRGSVAGNANYLGADSTCEPFTVNKAQLSVNTIVHNALHAPVTGNLPLGSVVHDTASVSGGVNGFTVPTPTFTFTSNYSDSCSAGSSVANAGPDPITGDESSIDSAHLAAGTYAYQGHVAGNANYLGADSSCEPVTINKADLSIVTHVHDASHVDKTNSSVPLGSVMHDTAAVTGGVSGFALPDVSFTMTTSYTNSCADGSTVANNGTEGSDAKSADSAALGAGAYAYRAVVASNANYNGSNSTCEPFTVNKGQLRISTDIHDPAHVVVTAVPLGTVVHDTASVAGSINGFAPTGSVTFYFGPGVAESCKDQNVYPVIATDANPDASTSGPRSIDTQSLGAGNYQFWAHVAGDANYLGADSACEPLTVNKAQLGITTNAHDAAHNDITLGNVPLGSITHDTATLTGVVNGFTPPTPTFTMTSNYTDSCANGAAVGNADMESTAYKSADSASLAAGMYAYRSVVAGDSNYLGATSDCEPFQVNKSDSSLTTELHQSNQAHTVVAVGGHVDLNTIMHDSATVTANGSFVPTGNVTFRFYANDSCDGTGTAMGTVALDGNNPGVAHPSSDTANLAAGNYSFKATWAGDSNYTGNTSSCENFIVDKAPTQTTTQVHDAQHNDITNTAVVVGSVVHDSATVGTQVGSFPITGNVVYHLFTNGTCDGTPADEVKTVGQESTPVGPLATGHYSFQADYLGNDNYTGSTGICEPFSVVNARIRITPQTATNEVGHEHTFTVTVEQDTGAGFVPVPAGTLANAIVSPAPTSFNAADCQNGVDVNGQCTVTLNSNTAGVFTVIARSTVVVDGVTFKLQTNGAGDNSGPATKTYVDAKIVLSPLTATNNITDPHTITATVSQNDGSGWSAAPDGTLVTFSLLNNTAGADFTPTSGSNTCTTTAGVCSVTINSATPGSVDIHATTTFSVGGVSLTRDTDGTHGSSGNANKLYVAGSLQVCKSIALGNYPFSVNTSFDIVVTGPSYPSGQHLTFTVTDGVVSGCQTLTPLIPGTYSVAETDPGVAWTVTGNGNVSVVANQTASKTVTNTLKQPHTTISITPNTFETAPGENVILTITETNDGNVPLTNPSVTLTYGATTVTLDKTHFYVSGDTGNDGIMGVGEIWTWSYQTTISADTTFNVAGHGTDPLGNDITTNHYPTEGGSTTVKVVGTTRTLGFWQTHTTFTSYVFNTVMGGTMTIGAAPHKGTITLSQLFGGFYAPIAKTSTGAKRNPVDQARITLLQQLIAAKLNCAAFGCSGATQTNIANADAAYAAGDKNAMMNYVSILDAYNNSGDSGAIPPALPATGKATPKDSQSIASISFWDNP